MHYVLCRPSDNNGDIQKGVEYGYIHQNIFQWKIPNFVGFDGSNPFQKYIESPEFTLVCKEGSPGQFKLRLYPNGHDDPNYIAIYLTYNSCIRRTGCYKPIQYNSFTLTYNRSVLDKDGNKFVDDSDITNTFCNGRRTWGSDRFIEINQLMKEKNTFLPDATLTILIEVEGAKAPKAAKDPTMCLVDDLETLSNDDEFTDVEIFCKDVTIKSHKAILSARSPVFRAMFSSPCIENKTGSVKIDNIEPEILKDLVAFIYSGKVKKLDENVTELFLAADMYLVESLIGNH